MPKKKTKKKTGKKPSSKKKAPDKIKVGVGESFPVLVSTLLLLEEKLAFLKDTIRKPKNGDLKLSFFINSSGEAVCFLFYGVEKIYYWGKLKGKTFIFDRSVPVKFLPKGQEKIDLSRIR